LTPLSDKYSIRYNTVLAVDKAYGFTADADDASGVRLEFLVNFTDYISKESSNNLFWDLGAAIDSARGENARYQKYSTGGGYVFESFAATLSSLRLGYQYLKYPDRSSPRTDNQLTLTYTLDKALSKNSNLGVSVAAVNNSSNTDLYKYNDVTAGLQYTKSIGF
jgi:hypothetical protein